MSILSDLTSKDADRIYSGACEVRLLRNREELKMLVEHLSVIRKLTSNIPLGGALYPNIAHLKFAIKKLEFVKYSKDCLCMLYSEDQFYNPEVEQNIGNIRILATKRIEDKWVDLYECECLECGANYRVTEGEYHYTWWAWKRI